MMPAESLSATPGAVDLAWTVCESPLGPLTLLGDGDGLRALYFSGRSGPLDEGARDGTPFADAIDHARGLNHAIVAYEAKRQREEQLQATRPARTDARPNPL